MVQKRCSMVGVRRLRGQPRYGPSGERDQSGRFAALTGGNQPEGDARNPKDAVHGGAKAATPFNADRFCPSLQDRFVASQDEETNRWSEIANSLEKCILVHWRGEREIVVPQGSKAHVGAEKPPR